MSFPWEKNREKEKIFFNKNNNDLIRELKEKGITNKNILSAIKKGVDVIEMDVVISKDHQVVVSHEPFMSSLYMLQPNGEPISKENEKDFNLFQMNYDSIKQFDSGSKGNKKFLQQKNMSLGFHY